MDVNWAECPVHPYFYLCCRSNTTRAENSVKQNSFFNAFAYIEPNGKKVMYMKKKWLKGLMTICMLCAVYLLSREGAMLAGKNMTGEKGLIMIDSGHGGIDPGVVGIGGIQEKEINLKIAKYLDDELKKNGYKVILTRKDDNGLYDEDSKNKKVQDMQRRCAMIKEEKPILTVSIHQNSYQDEAVCGPQVFYYKSSSEGANLAKCIQEELNTQLEVEKPRVEKANSTYYLLKRSEGVLNIVETGFLTNGKEAELLQTKDYQKKCAKAICDGILKFLKTVEINKKNVV